MHCEQAEMLLAPWAFGEIDADSPQGAELSEHLAVCEGCREKLGDVRVTAALLSEALAAEPAPALSSGRRQLLLKAARQVQTTPAPEKCAARATVSAVPRRSFMRTPLFWRKVGIAASLGIMGIAGVGLMMPELSKSRPAEFAWTTVDSEAGDIMPHTNQTNRRATPADIPAPDASQQQSEKDFSARNAGGARKLSTSPVYSRRSDPTPAGPVAAEPPPVPVLMPPATPAPESRSQAGGEMAGRTRNTRTEGDGRTRLNTLRVSGGGSGGKLAETHSGTATPAEPTAPGTGLYRQTDREQLAEGQDLGRGRSLGGVAATAPKPEPRPESADKFLAEGSASGKIDRLERQKETLAKDEKKSPEVKLADRRKALDEKAGSRDLDDLTEKDEQSRIQNELEPQIRSLERLEDAQKPGADKADAPAKNEVFNGSFAQQVARETVPLRWAAEATEQLKSQIEFKRAEGNIPHREIITYPPDGPQLSIVPQQQAQQMPAAEEELIDALPSAAQFPQVPVNPFVLTQQDRFSTFGLESESASYVLARRYIRSGYLPPRGSVRMEEFINHFDYHYDQTSSRTFAIHAQAVPSPFGENLSLIKIGVQAKTIGRENRKPAHLVFVVDASGSMARSDRLPLVRHALGVLAGELDARDSITLIAYSDQPRVLLEHTPANPAQIHDALQNLQTGRSTNLLEGLKWGYQQAADHYQAGAINRVILCTDGVANVGPTDAQEILEKVGDYRRQGITLTTLGFGAGQYNDKLMEDLAGRGDGQYAYVDTPAEARRLFVEQFASTLQTVAFDAKIQVEFNPQRVRRYRLIGYENRDIADKDFRNDTVDAGEVGSGRSATALYEVELINAPGAPQDLGTVYVRYRQEQGGTVEEISRRLEPGMPGRLKLEAAPHFYLAAAAAEFAEVLRSSPHARDGALEPIEEMLARLRGILPLDGKVAELHALVQQARGLPQAP